MNAGLVEALKPFAEARPWQGPDAHPWRAVLIKPLNTSHQPQLAGFTFGDLDRARAVVRALNPPAVQP